MAPAWLTVVAWLYLSVCFCCAGIIAYDIAFNHRRQPMGVMNFVFPITALYFGPFALAAVLALGPSRLRRTMTAANPLEPGRPASPGQQSADGDGRHADARRVQDADRRAWRATSRTTAASTSRIDRASPQGRAWVTMAIEVSHCGSGCTLGDVISEFAIIFGLGLTIAGVTRSCAEYAGDYILALCVRHYLPVLRDRADARPRAEGRPDCGGQGGLHLADRHSRSACSAGWRSWRSCPVPGTAPPHAQLGRLLAPHADRHDHRILQLLARKRLAGQPQHPSTHVTRASADAYSAGSERCLTGGGP